MKLFKIQFQCLDFLVLDSIAMPVTGFEWQNAGTQKISVKFTKTMDIIDFYVQILVFAA